MKNLTRQERQQLFAHLQSQLKSHFQIQDTSGIELFATLQHVAHLSEALECRSADADEMELSGPRWRLMLRLFMDEHLGHPGGLTPTVLSHSQRVTRNTISALLRGLEDQGLIRRELDPQDLRVFRIQLTDAGRECVMNSTPRRIEGLNRMVSGLSAEEREQLTNLLDKLHQSLLMQVEDLEKDQNKN